MKSLRSRKHKGKFGWVGNVFEVIFEIITFPFRILWEIIKFPFALLGEIFSGF